MDNRIKWLDWMKGIAIILVIVHHVTKLFPAMYLVPAYLTDFHVASFFFVGGAAVGLVGKKDRTIASFVKNRAKRLLIPYVFFSFLSSALKAAYYILKHDFSMSVLTDEFRQIITLGNGPVWFLAAMFVTSVLFYAMEKCLFAGKDDPKRLVKWIAVGVIYVACAVLVYYLQRYETSYSLLILFRRTLLDFLEFSLGYILAKPIVGVCRGKSAWLLGLLLFGLGTAGSFGLDIGISFKTGGSGNLLLAFPVCNLIVIGLCILLQKTEQCYRENRISKMMEYFGTNSLPILGVHPVILNAFNTVFSGYYSTLPDGLQIIVSLLLVSFIVAATVLVVNLMRKTVPILIGA